MHICVCRREKEMIHFILKAMNKLAHNCPLADDILLYFIDVT